MKILFIKQLFYPEPTARSLDFALELKKNGHEVQVLTGFPSYPEGKVYKGYKQKFFHREQIEGIDVIRVPIFPDQSGRALFRILNYLSYAISATLLGLPRVSKPDIVFVYQGALPVGIPAMIYKLFRRVPYVYDINDIWPDTLTASGMLKNKVMIGFVRQWCKLTYKMATHITVLSNGFKDKLISRNVKPEKIDVIYHWSRDKAIDITGIKETIKNKFSSDKFHVLYAGNVGGLQSLYIIIDAFHELFPEYPQLQFSILGDGSEKNNLVKYVNDKQIKNVQFLPRVSSDEVGEYLSCADLLLVHLKDEPLFRITIPSKIIGYLHASKPILLGIKGDAEQLVTDSKAGFIFEPDNVEDFKNKLLMAFNTPRTTLEKMGTDGKVYYDKNFTLDKNTTSYIKIFQKIIN